MIQGQFFFSLIETFSIEVFLTVHKLHTQSQRFCENKSFGLSLYLLNPWNNYGLQENFPDRKKCKKRVNLYGVHSSRCVQGNTSIDCDDVVNDLIWWIQILSAFIFK